MARVKTSAGRNAYRWDYQELRYLVHVLRQTKDFRETLNIFFDLHTKKEIAEIIRRLLITAMLKEKVTYEEIRRATGASPNTLSSLANRFLRQKSVLKTMLERAGTFEDFERSTAKRKDPVEQRLDRALRRATLGLLGQPPKSLL